MRRLHWPLLALLLASATCRPEGDPGVGPRLDPGVLSLEVLAPALAPVPATSGVARITGNGVDLSRTLTPGQSAGVEVPPGIYTLVLAGLADAAVVSLGQRTGIEVRAGAETQATVQLQPFVPDPPQAPASASAGESVTVQWEPVAGASGGYEVEWSPSPGFGSGAQRAAATGSSLDVTLPSAGVYFFRVRALTSAVPPAGYWSDPSAGTGAVAVDPPVITLSPDSVGFSGQAGGTAPPPRRVAVTNGGGGVLQGLAAVVTGQGGGPPPAWLSASLEDVEAPAGLLLTPDIEGLDPGRYAATVEVRSGDLDVEPASVEVTLDLSSVTAPPTIDLNVTRRAFAAQAGGLPPPAQFIEVANGGGGTLDGLSLTVLGSGAPPDGWLTVALDTTAAPATITLQPDIRRLAVGNYTSTLRVSAEGADNSPQSVIVTLSVREAPVPPSIVLGNDSVSFEAVEGEDPADQTVSVGNGGAGTLARLSTAVASYGAGAEGWLSADISGSTAPATVTLGASTAGLEAGTYSAVVEVRSPQADNNPRSIAVTLTVTAAPPDTFAVALSASPADGGTVSGGGDFEDGSSVTVVATANSGYSFTRWTESGTEVSTSASYTFTVTEDRTLVAVFTADPAASIAVSGDSVAFTAEEGSEPADQTVSITNGGDGTLGGLAATVGSYTGGATGWLEAALSSTTAPSTLTLGATAAGLAPGDYTATVDVTSTSADNSPQPVTVTLTVTAAPPDTFAVALSASPTEGGTVSGGGDFEDGSSVTVVATANSGYSFTRWTESGTEVSTSASYTFTAAGDRTLVAVFTAIVGSAIGLSTDSIVFNTPEGENPSQQVVAVTNIGTGVLTLLRTSVGSYTGGASGWLDADLNRRTAPATLRLRPDDVDELEPGVYTAAVQVLAALAVNSPQTVQVTLTVTPQASSLSLDRPAGPPDR